MKYKKKWCENCGREIPFGEVKYRHKYCAECRGIVAYLAAKKTKEVYAYKNRGKAYDVKPYARKVYNVLVRFNLVTAGASEAEIRMVHQAVKKTGLLRGVEL